MKFFSELRLYLCNSLVCNIPSHKFRLWFYRRIFKLKIGCDSAVFLSCKFDAAGGFKMGNNSVINNNCRLDTRGEIEIGNNVSISNDVIILTADHDLNSSSFESRNKPVIIMDYVWIGTRAMILPGVIVEEGAVIAAGAVVTKNVDKYTVVGGVPARPIGKRSSNLDYKFSYFRLFQ